MNADAAVQSGDVMTRAMGVIVWEFIEDCPGLQAGEWVRKRHESRRDDRDNLPPSLRDSMTPHASKPRRECRGYIQNLDGAARQ